MSLYAAMKNAGLGRAMKDAKNKTHQDRCHRHSQMFKSFGWNFCPHCGIKLEIVAHCDRHRRRPNGVRMTLRERILKLLHDSGPMTQEQIGVEVGERSVPIFIELQEMLRDGLIAEAEGKFRIRKDNK